MPLDPWEGGRTFAIDALCLSSHIKNGHIFKAFLKLVLSYVKYKYFWSLLGRNLKKQVFLVHKLFKVKHVGSYTKLLSAS